MPTCSLLRIMRCCCAEFRRRGLGIPPPQPALHRPSHQLVVARSAVCPIFTACFASCSIFRSATPNISAADLSLSSPSCRPMSTSRVLPKVEWVARVHPESDESFFSAVPAAVVNGTRRNIFLPTTWAAGAALAHVRRLRFLCGFLARLPSCFSGFA